MRGPKPGGGDSVSGMLSQSGQSLAIVLIVLILGATFYLWRGRYLRSRAALITIAGIIAVLIYAGFFAGNPPT